MIPSDRSVKVSLVPSFTSERIPPGSDNMFQNIEKLLIDRNGHIAIFDCYWSLIKRNKQVSFIFEIKFEYVLKLQKRDDDYMLAMQVMTIKPKITVKMQQNLRLKYFGAAFLYSQTLICSFIREALR